MNINLKKLNKMETLTQKELTLTYKGKDYVFENGHTVSRIDESGLIHFKNGESYSFDSLELMVLGTALDGCNVADYNDTGEGQIEAKYFHCSANRRIAREIEKCGRYVTYPDEVLGEMFSGVTINNIDDCPAEMSVWYCYMNAIRGDSHNKDARVAYLLLKDACEVEKEQIANLIKKKTMEFQRFYDNLNESGRKITAQDIDDYLRGVHNTK